MLAALRPPTISRRSLAIGWRSASIAMASWSTSIEIVDALIVGGDAGRFLEVALAHRVDRIGELNLGEPTLSAVEVLQPPQLIIEQLDDMFGVHAGHLHDRIFAA